MITRRPLRLNRFLVATVATLIALAGSVTPVGAWANGPNAGNGYGTHDWILDQAFRLLDKRGFDTSWVDRTTALLATDDPDYIEVAADPSRSIEHTYTGGGKRGGAVDRITEHYAAIVRLYKQGDFEGASYNLGMLAHFYGDILQPYHTSRDAIGKTSTHYNYEVLHVDKSHQDPHRRSRLVGREYELGGQGHDQRAHGRDRGCRVLPRSVPDPGRAFLDDEHASRRPRTR